jgi:homoserine dehydrogenase
MDGDVVGETLYYGRGAGRLPTASAVIGDIMEAAIKRRSGQPEPLMSWMLSHPEPRMIAPEANEVRCYLRMGLKDQPDMLARVAHVLGDHNISIASVVQKEPRENDPDWLPVVFLTHRARESEFSLALEKLSDLEGVQPGVIRLAVEDFTD